MIFVIASNRHLVGLYLNQLFIPDNINGVVGTGKLKFHFILIDCAECHIHAVLNRIKIVSQLLIQIIQSVSRRIYFWFRDGLI